MPIKVDIDPKHLKKLTAKGKRIKARKSHETNVVNTIKGIAQDAKAMGAKVVVIDSMSKMHDRLPTRKEALARGVTIVAGGVKPVLGTYSVAAWKPEGMSAAEFKRHMAWFRRMTNPLAKGLRGFKIKVAIDHFIE